MPGRTFTWTSWGNYPRPPWTSWAFGPFARTAPLLGNRFFNTPLMGLPPWHSYSGRPWVGELFSAYGRGIEQGYLNGFLGSGGFRGNMWGTPSANSVKVLDFVTKRSVIVYKGFFGIPTWCGSDGEYNSRAMEFDDFETIGMYNGASGPWICRGPSCPPPAATPTGTTTPPTGTTTPPTSPTVEVPTTGGFPGSVHPMESRGDGADGMGGSGGLYGPDRGFTFPDVIPGPNDDTHRPDSSSRGSDTGGRAEDGNRDTHGPEETHG